MNAKLIEQLSILQEAERRKGGSGVFQAAAYKNAISIIEGLGEPFVNIQQIKGKVGPNSNGIGEKLKIKLQFFLDNGFIKQARLAQEQETDRDRTITELESIKHIGLKKATQLYEKNNIRSIKQLREYVRSGRVTLDKNQVTGLKYYEKLREKISRRSVYVFGEAIRFMLLLEYGPEAFRLEVVGSYRRGKSESGDIDIAIATNKFTTMDMKKLMERYGLIVADFGFGPTKLTILAHCRNNLDFIFQVDIRIVPPKSFAALLLYFGSGVAFAKSMRQEANKQGYRLNEYCLTNIETDEKMYFPTEKEYFDFLGMSYKPPELR